jgi:UDP-2-acetamido-2-deoxy-ribo-hexuluronate aminotransferase
MFISDLLISPQSLAEAMRDERCAAAEAIARARTCGVRLWLSAGLIAAYRDGAPSIAALSTIAANMQWLSVLAGDVDILVDAPIADLLRRGRARLGVSACILGRDPGQLSPGDLLGADLEAPPIAFIDLAAQQDRIRPELERRIDAVIRHGHYIMGPEVAELEQRLAAFVDVPHAIAVASGTDSLEIAYRALGIGAGDEVITTPFTWISTAETIVQVGAKPVFCDIEPVGFNLDPERVAAAITSKTKAIVPVSLFGQPCEIERILEAAQGIPVIEDAAQSFGSTRRGRRSCSLTPIASTSFFPAKPLGCYGDGGCLFTNDDLLAARMRAIRTHGGVKRHHHPYVGMNGRLDTLQAAILLAKWPLWQDEVEARGAIGSRYNDALRGIVGVPEVLSGNTHVFAQYTIRIKERDAAAERLGAAGVPTAIYYPKCLHEQPVFAGCGTLGQFPASEQASREVLSLPMCSSLNSATQDRIITAVRMATQA